MVDTATAPSGNAWTRLANSNPIMEFIDVTLRGSGQVIFMDNPLTGLLNFVAMFVGAARGRYLWLQRYAGGRLLANLPCG